MGWPSRGFPCGTSIVGLHEDDYRRTACMSRSESTMEGLARQDISDRRRRVVVSPTNVTRPKSRCAVPKLPSAVVARASSHASSWTDE